MNFPVILGLLSCAVSCVPGTTISVQAPDMIIAGSEELRITCSPNPSNLSGITSIKLSRNTTMGDYEDLVSVYFDFRTFSGKVKWYNSTLQHREGVTVEGEATIPDPSTAQLVFKIEQNFTRCEDSGNYKCEMGAVRRGGERVNAVGEKYIASVVLPSYTENISVIPQYGYDHQQHIYSVGTSVTMTCTGTVGSQRLAHQWCYKQATDNNFQIYPFPNNIDQNDDGVTLVGCNYLRSSTLTYNVSATDMATMFTCEPKTSGCGKTESDLRVAVTIKNNYIVENITIEPDITSYNLTQGQRLPNITCTATCIPECTYIWYKDSQPHSVGHGLELNTIQHKEEGTYTCVAKNPYGNLSSRSITVTIAYDVSNITVAPNTEFYNLTVGDTLPTIKCIANCFPECSYKWFKDGQSHLKGPDLSFSNVQRKDEGIYKCEARNLYESETSGDIHVKVNSIPDSTQRPNTDTSPHGNSQGIHMAGVALIWTVLLVSIATPGYLISLS